MEEPEMPEDPAARRVVARRYELIAPHRPGSRTVWHARDRVLRRDVVVQLLRLPPAERPAMLRQVRAAVRSPRLGAVVILAAVLDGDDIAVVAELPIARTPAEIVAELTGPGPKPATGEPARFTPSSTWRDEPLPSSKVAGPTPVARKRWRLGPGLLGAAICLVMVVALSWRPAERPAVVPVLSVVPPRPVAALPALRIYRHDAGFTVLVPAGWAAEERARRVAFRAPDGTAAMAVSWTDGPFDPFAELRDRAGQFESAAGYRQLRLDRDGTGAAVWEYRAGDVHGWARAVQGGSRGFVLSIEVPERTWSAAQPTLRRIGAGPLVSAP
jgi:hypothetical protein